MILKENKFSLPSVETIFLHSSHRNKHADIPIKIWPRSGRAVNFKSVAILKCECFLFPILPSLAFHNT